MALTLNAYGDRRGMNSTPPRRKPSKLATLGLMQVMAKTGSGMRGPARPAYEKIADRGYGAAARLPSKDLEAAFGPCQDRGRYVDWSEHPKED